MKLRMKKKAMSQLMVILNDNSGIIEAFCFLFQVRCSIYVVLVTCFRQWILCVFIIFMFQLVLPNIH